MATYNPPQPFWKRAIAGVLDFLLAFSLIGLIIANTVGSRPAAKTGGGVDLKLSATGVGFNIEGWPALLVFGLVIAYFVILGRTGGTVFQRLFGMKRA